MSKWLWALPLATVAAGSATSAGAAPPPPPPPPPEWDMVAFETKSWGEPLSSWRLGKDGGGSWTQTVRKDGARLGDYSLAFHEIATDVQNYIAIERILSLLPEPAPDSSDCANFLSDLPYGTIRLTRGATTTEIAWNSGCMDENYKPFLDVLKRADMLVRKWGESSPILRTETALPSE